MKIIHHLRSFFVLLVTYIFSFIRFVGECRKKRTTAYHVVLLLVITPLFTYLNYSVFHNLDSILLYISITSHKWQSVGNGWKYFLMGALSLVATYSLNILFPFLYYCCNAIAMTELGLVEVSTSKNASFKFQRKYRKLHLSDNKIKVICISGKYIFGLETDDDNLPLPLHKDAKDGKLDVIMPSSTPANKTITLRWETYSTAYRHKNNINTIQAFLDEISINKGFLERHQNTTFEHNILCMWRVIIFDRHCIMQNYFPNDTHDDSYKAPVFVFERPPENTENSKNYYYNTFNDMFNLIKKSESPL